MAQHFTFSSKPSTHAGLPRARGRKRRKSDKDGLRKVFGEDNVFMDVRGIDPGKDFRKVIDGAVSGCDVLIVMIGKKWLDTSGDRGERRIDDSEDFVRMETAAALRRDIPVVPVLIQGTVMPRSVELPGELEALAWRNAFELRHARWEIDVAELIKALRKIVRVPEMASKTGPRADHHSRLSGHKNWVALLALTVAAVAGGMALMLWLPGGLRSPLRADAQLSVQMSELEYGINRAGDDYRSFGASEPQVCQSSCAKDTQCVAFTFVKAGVQGSSGVCWLKDRVSLPNSDANCISGIKVIGSAPNTR